ncbi:NAD(P)H-dependent oxidoreductase [Rickettsiales bacterium]|nr:NAD(P)H-dependent oxidoreductase [Rickettsiales bacterium]
MKILSFGASNSLASINKQLAIYASSLVKNATIEIIDLNDYQLPLFSEDKEKELGKPELAKNFLNKIADNDVIIISFAEHNGSYTVAYKNLFDWCSRIEKQIFQNKKMILLSTSPGPRGGSNVLESAIKSIPFFAGNIIGAMSVPNFYDNFDREGKFIKDDTIKSNLIELLNKL